MLELTTYGKAALADQGIYLSKIGKPIEPPKKFALLSRCKKIDFSEEERKKDDQKIQSLGGEINELVQRYFTEPTGLTSNRKKKIAKKSVENYENEANLGFKTGDREKFNNLSRKIRLECLLPDQRPPGEMIFRKLARIMSVKPDRAGPVTENCF